MRKRKHILKGEVLLLIEKRRSVDRSSQKTEKVGGKGGVWDRKACSHPVNKRGGGGSGEGIKGKKSR